MTQEGQVFLSGTTLVPLPPEVPRELGGATLSASGRAACRNLDGFTGTRLQQNTQRVSSDPVTLRG